MAFRIETDSLGQVQVPSSHYYGAQTVRSMGNFPIGSERMPLEVIYAYALIKKACALVNSDLGLLSEEKRDLILYACDQILSKKLDEEFPLLVWQTGSGTQTNMNVNEVISNVAINKARGVLGSKDPIHPNDHVNMSQSSNDTFPTAMHISAKLLIENKLLPNLETLRLSLEKKAEEFALIVKVGRTHLMDATPLTLGQEFSGYVKQLEDAISSLKNSLGPLSEIALGGSAVGTGINTHPEFALRTALTLSAIAKSHFKTAPNKFAALAGNDAILGASSALRQVAVVLMKIANDIRWLGSGPRCGLGELYLPANEPGSSIMPGKVNPTQSEALYMVAIQVLGNDSAIAWAASAGNFELNVCRPLMIYNILQSIHLLADGAVSFQQRCVDGIKPNFKRITDNLNRSLMLATVLNTTIGYDKAALIVKKAYEEDLSLKEAALALHLLSSEEFDQIVDPTKMVFPHG